MLPSFATHRELEYGRLPDICLPVSNRKQRVDPEIAGSNTLGADRRAPVRTEDESFVRLLDTLGPVAKPEQLRLIATAIRQGGVYEVATPLVRAKAHGILSAYILAPQAEHLLKRLANGGPTQAGAYDLYLGTHLLTNWNPSDPPEMILSHVSRAAAERLEILLHLPELKAHDRRDKLEHMTNRAITHFRMVGFAEAPARALDPLCIEVSLLPESAVADEIIFMAVTQVCETIFKGVADILANVEQHIAFARALQGASGLKVAVRLLEFLSQAGGVLAPMRVEDWLAIRDFIVLPSAIQSTAYRDLLAGIWRVMRILGHDRYPEWESPYVSDAGAALLTLIRAVQRWESLHLGLASKYGGVKSRDALPDTLTYLDRQLNELDELIRTLEERYSPANTQT